MNQNKSLIIMWYGYSRRATSLSKKLDFDLLLVDSVITKSVHIRKYLLWLDYLIKSIYTFFELIKRRPENVIATTPPSFCPMISFIYCRIFNKKFIIDTHNSGFMSPWIKVPFYKTVLKKADLILVHNQEEYEYLKNLYKDYKFFVLPDPLPDFSPNIVKENLSNSEKYFLVILSFSSDEPVEIIFQAIKIFLEHYDGYKFKITGNYKKNKVIYNQYCKINGIEFLGFVDEKLYERYLINAYGIITLSTKPMVQQSAAIEALGACVPLICEESSTNKRIFPRGAVLSKIKLENLFEAIKFLSEENDRLKIEISSDKKDYMNKYEELIKAFKASLQ